MLRQQFLRRNVLATQYFKNYATLSGASFHNRNRRGRRPDKKVEEGNSEGDIVMPSSTPPGIKPSEETWGVPQIVQNEVNNLESMFSEWTFGKEYLEKSNFNLDDSDFANVKLSKTLSNGNKISAVFNMFGDEDTFEEMELEQKGEDGEEGKGAMEEGYGTNQFAIHVTLETTIESENNEEEKEVLFFLLSIGDSKNLEVHGVGLGKDASCLAKNGFDASLVSPPLCIALSRELKNYNLDEDFVRFVKEYSEQLDVSRSIRTLKRLRRVFDHPEFQF